MSNPGNERRSALTSASPPAATTTSDSLVACRGHAVVVQPDQGASFWQPVPANGHADPKLTPAQTRFDGFSMGYQSIAPGSHIRAHSHAQQVELQICFSGRGHVLVDGERHELVPGTACFLGPDVVHEIHNEHDEPLVQLWVIGPAGLEDFFAAIGRPRVPGEAAPPPFERPGDVVAIERSMGMDNT
ncbi:MAG: cupin domain-containing protein [Gammaproteobacteria bacterium]|nr:cupin domain-containing protein [Gammaproteobacteria bacterium]